MGLKDSKESSKPLGNIIMKELKDSKEYFKPLGIKNSKDFITNAKKLAKNNIMVMGHQINNFKVNSINY